MFYACKFTPTCGNLIERTPKSGSMCEFHRHLHRKKTYGELDPVTGWPESYPRCLCGTYVVGPKGGTGGDSTGYTCDACKATGLRVCKGLPDQSTPYFVRGIPKHWASSGDFPLVRFTRCDRCRTVEEFRHRTVCPDCLELYRYKTENPCVWCGEYFPDFVMTLDHVDPDNKISEVNRKTIHSTQFDWRVEIQKCQLLCFNDHALKTHMVDDYLEPFDYMSGSYPGNKKLFRQRLDKGC